jgi:hypothetical protein
MELNEERYWQALRQLLKRAEDDEAAELAAAERMLADTKPDPDSHFSDERIAEVVRLVTEADTSVAVANATDDVIDGVLRSAPVRVGYERRTPVASVPIAPMPGPSPAPARAAVGETAAAPVVSLASSRAKLRQRLAKLPRPLAAAAMILLAPQFLAAAGVVTVVVVASQLMSYSSTSVTFEDAITITVNPEQPERSRQSSQQVVAAHLIESIALIQQVGDEGSEVSAAAKQALVDFLVALAQPGPFVNRALRDPHIELGDQVANTANGSALRADALRRLVEQVKYGLSALSTVGETTAEPALKRDNSLIQQKLQAQLTR